MACDKSVEQGFTLVEVLVALLVSAFLLAVISTALETARARDVKVSEQARALLIGEEYLARRAERDFEPGDHSDARGKFEVRVSEQSIEEDARRFFVLSEIRVSVTNNKGQTLYRAALRHLKAIPQT